MSFPHRTWFYDREEYGLMSPARIRELQNDGVIELEDIHQKPDGRVFAGIKPDLIGDESNRYIPLASTGLEDSEGQEIIEGHVLITEPNDAAFKSVVVWSDNEGAFKKVFFDPRYCPMNTEEWDVEKYGHRRCPLDSHWYHNDEVVVGENGQDGERITGHALTHPELVPDGFDPAEYWSDYDLGEAVK